MSWLLNLSEQTREMVRKDIKEFADTRALEVDSHSITLFMLEEINSLRKRVSALENPEYKSNWPRRDKDDTEY